MNQSENIVPRGTKFPVTVNIHANATAMDAHFCDMKTVFTRFQVGLAVDDIKGTLEKAVLKRLALQVELALSIEALLPTRFRRQFIIGGQVIKYPNKPPNRWKRLRYQMWGNEGLVSSQNLVRS